MNHTSSSSSETLLMLLRAALGNEAVGALPSNIDWQEVIDLSFGQGVAAMLVDGIDKATKTIVRQAHQPNLENSRWIRRSWRT